MLKGRKLSFILFYCRPKKFRNLPKSLYQPSIEGDLEKVIYMLSKLIYY